MYKVLLVEDSDADAYIVTRLLKTPPAQFDVTHAASLSGALTCLARRQDFSAILLDLNLGDCQGLETLVQINEHAPSLPIIVLTGIEDTELAENAVRRGAQDYLVKSDISGGILDRTIRLSWARKRKDQVRRELTYATADALSGDKDPAIVSVLRGHIRGTTAFLEDLRQYIAMNAPSHVEALQRLEEKHGIELILRDMSGMLRLTGRPRKASDRALEVVAASTREIKTPLTGDEARLILLDSIEGRT